jgi:hypothetical protein
MKILTAWALMAGTLGLCAAQVAPPPPDASMTQATTTVNGSITGLNYGPEGEVDGFVLSNNVLVNVPRAWSAKLDGVAHTGDQVSVTGWQTASPSGMRIIDSQTLKVGSKTFSRDQAGQAQAFQGSSTIKQLNYGRRGEVNGFLLQNGMLARTTPFAVVPAQIKVGTSVTISGTVHQTMAGMNVIDVQTLAANGQTIAMAAPPPPRPERPGRHARLMPPPPPPAPDGVAPPAPPAPPAQ